MDRSSGNPPPPHPPLETSRTFFRYLSCRFLRLSVVYKSIKGTLGAKPGTDDEHRNILKM